MVRTQQDLRPCVSVEDISNCVGNWRSSGDTMNHQPDRRILKRGTVMSEVANRTPIMKSLCFAQNQRLKAWWFPLNPRRSKKRRSNRLVTGTSKNMLMVHTSLFENIFLSGTEFHLQHSLHPAHPTSQSRESSRAEGRRSAVRKHLLASPCSVQCRHDALKRLK